MTEASGNAGYQDALDAFLRSGEAGWADLPALRDRRTSDVVRYLDERVAGGLLVLPAPSDVFNALRLAPLKMVRVVILGQDPYPTPGDAHGLSFSVRPGVRIPRSLANIFRELRDDIGAPSPSHGSLEPWARQGVLMLNAVLTVEAGQAGSHRKLGWENVTDAMIRAVSDRAETAVFILWGADAQAKRPMIADRHPVIQSPHPSPLSARRGFFGSRPFSRANAYLEAHGREAVDWRLP